MNLQVPERTIPIIDFGYLIFLCFKDCSKGTYDPEIEV